MGKITIKKKEGWEDKLIKAVESFPKQKFDRGAADCVRTVSALVYSFTEYDLAAPFSKLYGTDKEALRFCLENKGMESLVESRMLEAGMSEVPVRKATTGDILFFRQRPLGCVAIFVAGKAVTQGDNGLETRRPYDAVKAWRIPLDV